MLLRLRTTIDDQKTHFVHLLAYVCGQRAFDEYKKRRSSIKTLIRTRVLKG